jgi:hypothetical protein
MIEVVISAQPVSILIFATGTLAATTTLASQITVVPAKAGTQ